MPKYGEIIETFIKTLVEPTILNDAKENPVPVASRFPEKAPIPVSNHDPLRVGPPRYPRLLTLFFFSNDLL